MAPRSVLQRQPLPAAGRLALLAVALAAGAAPAAGRDAGCAGKFG
jgi:hypothetical protein